MSDDDLYQKLAGLSTPEEVRACFEEHGIKVPESETPPGESDDTAGGDPDSGPSTTPEGEPPPADSDEPPMKFGEKKKKAEKGALDKYGLKPFGGG